MSTIYGEGFVADKRPCADCDNVEPCDMLERCIKHDPAPKTFDNYTRLTTPGGTHVDPCPVCAADPELWQYIAKEGDVAQKVVMCSHDDEIGPHDALAGGGCPLYMPPQSFYRPTIREAVRHWNDYAKALTALRASRTHGVMATPVSLSDERIRQHATDWGIDHTRALLFARALLADADGVAAAHDQTFSPSDADGDAP